jgi:hypothetical protein
LLALAKTEDDREVIQEVIEALVEGRLLVTDQPSSLALLPSLGENMIDLAHEALMTGWQRFADWRQKGPRPPPPDTAGAGCREGMEHQRAAMKSTCYKGGYWQKYGSSGKL